MLSLYLQQFDDENDRVKFTEIYYRYEQQVLKTARAYLYDISFLQDCVQDTFLELAHSFETFIELSELQQKAYLVTICKRSAIRINNKFKKEEYIPLEESVTDKEAFDSFNFLEYTGTEIVDAIKKLDEKYRYPIFLKYVYGYHISEIANILGLSDNLVLQRLYRGRNKVVSFLTGGETEYE